MNNYLYLLKNIGLLTLSSVSTRFITFLLVPIYTSVLSTEEYGIYDLLFNAVGLMLPIITLNIQESVMRFLMDDNYDKKSIFSVGFKIVLFSNLIVGILLLINHILVFSNIIKDYAFFFLFMYTSQSFCSLMSMYTQGIKKIFDLSLSSVLASVCTILLTLFLLLVLELGLEGFFIANIAGPLLQSIYLFLKGKAYKQLSLYPNKKKDVKDMLLYCCPLIITTISWWINNASDRYLVLLFCGLGQSGIYAIASKLPSILSTFSAIFNQAWMVSAIKMYQENKDVKFFSNTYKSFNFLIVMACSGLIVFNKILSSFLYSNEFFISWKYVPLLTIALVFGSLIGYLNGIFYSAKKTKIVSFITLFGAISNILLNILLIPLFDTMGAAVATAISYYLIWQMLYIKSRTLIKLNIRIFRDLVAYILLLIQATIFLFVDNTMYAYGIQIALSLCILTLFKNEVEIFFNKLLSRKNKNA